MNEAVPLWGWPPGATEPVQAASLAPENDLFRFTYLSAYTGASKNERGATVPLDPVSLRFKKGATLCKLECLTFRTRSYRTAPVGRLSMKQGRQDQADQN